jgi:hypothetical protein
MLWGLESFEHDTWLNTSFQEPCVKEICVFVCEGWCATDSPECQRRRWFCVCWCWHWQYTEHKDDIKRDITLFISTEEWYMLVCVWGIQNIKNNWRLTWMSRWRVTRQRKLLGPHVTIRSKPGLHSARYSVTARGASERYEPPICSGWHVT